MTERTESPVEPVPRRPQADRYVAWLLSLCAMTVAIWQVMAAVAARPHGAHALTSDFFDAFVVDSPGWSVRRLPLHSDPREANVIVMEWVADSPLHAIERRPLLVRLVHGYNMCDCMRIKGYGVEALADTRTGAEDTLAAAGRGLPSALQIWALTSPSGDRTIWVSSLLRSSDFSATDVDVRSMEFPRVGIPDPLDWNPQGLSLRALRHPLRNGRLFLRSKWNGSRCDVLTFLRLKRGARPTDEMFTLVSATRGIGVPEADTAAAIRHVVSAHMAMRAALAQYGLQGDLRPRLRRL